MKWVKTPHVDPSPGPTPAERLHEFRNPEPHENEAQPTGDHMIGPDEQDDTGFTEGATC